ncbi:energy-coupling factor ABC transporter substrate-binding protein [Propionibacterium australiense]|uniref:Cobalt transport protein CbiN n=1 Tax=Propionibacterium australiense TaxID=119981 RepID=A0A383S9B6_9ACTN|nr:energy-coupling factor ABC transporter substrate-binding protein [Propionibacterium australiense]RLP07168.1 energy-coupling factor ABC transporter substrate-binding protein [Propionibacterium australiense]RLP07544.1 energy-coupling factor ABC transporter substrate-binding protein [Propionibacterium australiense]SYZ34142.1 Cobalt transport protein CbiN [Propionibacterium australiense]VEH92603.1 Energy-coupling factor transporter probable substrate-capture protein CbiN [Propionibacterium austr
MSERVTTASGALTSSKKWVNWVLLGAVVLIFLVSLVVGNRMAGGSEEAFVGTDDAATEAAEEAGAEPWFEPLFEPAGEVESGLFAIQAAIGSGIICFCIGRMSGRHAAARQAAEAGSPEAARVAEAEAAGAQALERGTPAESDA